MTARQAGWPCSVVGLHMQQALLHGGLAGRASDPSMLVARLAVPGVGYRLTVGVPAVRLCQAVLPAK